MQRQVRMIVLLALAALAVSPVEAAQPPAGRSGSMAPGSDPMSTSRSGIGCSGRRQREERTGSCAGLEYRFRPWVGLSLDAAPCPTGHRAGGRPSRRAAPGRGQPRLHALQFRSGVSPHARQGGRSHRHGGAWIRRLRRPPVRRRRNELNLQGGRDYCWGVGAAVDIRPGTSNWRFTPA